METDAYLGGAILALLIGVHHIAFVQEEVRTSMPPQFGDFAAKLAMAEQVWSEAVPSEARRRYVIAISWGTLMFALLSVHLYRNGRELAAQTVSCLGLYGAWQAWRTLRRYVGLDCPDLSTVQIVRLMLFGPATLPPRRGSPTDGP